MKGEKQKIALSVKNIVAILLKRSLFGRKLWAYDRSYFLIRRYAEQKLATGELYNRKCDTATHSRTTFAIVVSPDGSKIASAHGDYTVKIFSARDGHLIQTLSGYSRSPWCLSFHPTNNDLLATGCLDRQVRLWDLKMETNVKFHPPDNHVVSSVAFHPEIDVLLIASGNLIYFWQWKTGETLHMLRTSHFSEPIRIIRFHPTGKWLMTGIFNNDENCISQYSLLNVVATSEPFTGYEVYQSASCHHMIGPAWQASSNASAQHPRHTGDIEFLPTTSSQSDVTLPTYDSARLLEGRQTLPSTQQNATPLINTNADTTLATNAAYTINTTHGTDATQTTSVAESTDARTHSRQDPCASDNSPRTLPNCHEHCSNATRCLYSSCLTNGVRQQRTSHSSAAPYLRRDSPHLRQTVRLSSFVPNREDFPENPLDLDYRRIPVEVTVTDSSITATATAQTRRHVHTAMVVAITDVPPERAASTAVSRALAGVLAGFGNSAIATNIIDTSQRIQMWATDKLMSLDILDAHSGMVVPHCKIHHDSSIDISQDGEYLAVFVPSQLAYPLKGFIAIFGLTPNNFGKCIFKQPYGHNAVCVSISPCSSFLMVGVACSRLEYQGRVSELMAHVITFSSNRQFRSKLVRVITHNYRSQDSISVNVALFHPSPGEGIIYGTNTGLVHHVVLRSAGQSISHSSSIRSLFPESPDVSESSESSDE